MLRPLSVLGPFDEISLLIVIFTVIPLAFWSGIRSGIEKTLGEREWMRESLNDTLHAAEFLGWSLYSFTVLVYSLFDADASLELSGLIVALIIILGSAALLLKFREKELKARRAPES